MPDVISYQVAGAVDSYGDITFGSVQTYRARIVGQQKMVTSFEGNEVTSNHTVYVAGVIIAQPQDRITISTGIVNSTQESAINPVIVGAARVPDQRGTHHSTLYLG